MIALRILKKKFQPIWPHLDERARRMTAANEAQQLGYGEAENRVRPWGLGLVGRILIPDGLNLNPADEGPGGGHESGVAFGEGAHADQIAIADLLAD